MNGKSFSLLTLDFRKLCKWVAIILIVSIVVGSASAFFLATLAWATDTRVNNDWLIFLLPIGGAIIGLSYGKWGANVTKGNNVILEEYYQPKRRIDWVMAPLVYLGTILTHLFGGSAGREGTAVQIGASLADQFSDKWVSGKEERRLLITLGVSAGFSAVFGTPITGAVFAMEVNGYSGPRWHFFLPSLLVAHLSFFTCSFFPVVHTHYPYIIGPNFDLYLGVALLLLGSASGGMAYVFVLFTRLWAILFKRIKKPIWRPIVGGLVISSVTYYFSSYKYIGLGIPTILESFESPKDWYNSIVKVVYTTFTLGAGFKGGEVTPLFFIGATLGNSFGSFFNLPLDFLAAIGFVSVFSGATNTPFACTVMAAELFGFQILPYALFANLTAYLISGPKGIYISQQVSSVKFWPNKLLSNGKRLFRKR